MWMIIALILSVAITGCGKKGPPTLKAYEPPKSAVSLNAIRLEDHLTISWDLPLQDKKRLHRLILTKDHSGREEEIAIAPDASEYKDRGIRDFQIYRYRIRAVNKKGIAGDPSRELIVYTCPVPEPVSNVGFKVHNDFVEIKWGAPQLKAPPTDKCDLPLRYNIYRTDTASGIAEAPMNEAPLVVRRFKAPLVTDRKVYYTIRALLEAEIIHIGAPSERLAVGPADYIPSAPLIINTAIHEGRVFILWKEAPESWVKGYRIYKKDNLGRFELVSEVSTPVFIEQVGSPKETTYRITSMGPLREGMPTEIKVLNDKR